MTQTISLRERRLSVAGVRPLTTAKKRFTTAKILDVTESDVKKAVKDIVKGMAPNAYVFMPVQSGYGSPDLDFIITINGFDLRIETKVAPKKVTPRQMNTTILMGPAGITVLWIDQTNLEDVAVVVDLLLVGKQAEAFNISAESRQEHLHGR